MPTKENSHFRAKSSPVENRLKIFHCMQNANIVYHRFTLYYSNSSFLKSYRAEQPVIAIT